jgi:hypothetical protein
VIPLRRFNNAGIEAFEDALDRIGAGEDIDVAALLAESSHTDRLSPEPIVEVRPFTNRFDAAQQLNELLRPFEGNIGDIERDKGLWAWLAAAWLDVLVPKDASGHRKLGARARWIPAVDDYSRYYRHLLAGPYRIYRAHQDDPSKVMAVLATAVAQPGDVVEQLASRQEIITSPSLMAAITTLYFNPATGRLKAGAAGKGPGSARRVADVIQQFDLTWDVYGMDPSKFLSLLPSEFDRFKP